ncbi:hypothetical protein F5Y05DRAFT_412274 [Hypoxylon sp. FL0543]|nr:hypothetical protein F5Y05DRAFT_412274 [Hypoxylon sp. FL0543]
MEALAVVGLACNIIQLIECGYKVIVMARDLHGSGQEAIQANENAAFVAQEMRELSLRVMNELPASGLTDDEQALCRLAQQCSQLSNKLLVLLDSLKLGNTRRKRDTVIVVFRNLRKRVERERLQACLDDYRNQLNIQMNRISHSDLIRRVEQTLSTTSMSRQDILYLRDQVQKLRQKSTIDSASMIAFFRQLQEVVEIPLRQFAILQSIRYPRMHDRFENVDTAHRKTFEWLLHGPEGPQDYGKKECAQDTSQSQHPVSNQPGKTIQAKREQHKEFTTWLQGGNISHPPGSASLHMSSDESNAELLHRGSIFRIAGKPGAGKSTLMKFICESKTTLEYLKAWSGEKHLIYAKAFFWRLGDDDQKNLSGLANCLLHQILKAAPQLIPFAFPLAWEADVMEPVPFDPTGRQAFDLLLRSERAFDNHKMIFFIDGLDEFEGRPFELIREIVGWATRNPSGLKICVASRQWNEFDIGFQGYPSLRIHEWTRDDIQIFVTDRFDEISDLSTSVNKHDLDTLAEVIVDKAEGVFLWVRVVLAAIEEGVLNGDDLEDLEGKVAAFPSELKDLYQHLFDSIPDYDRQKAFEILIFTHYQNTSIPQALLRYKFLGDISKDPDFATKLSMKPLREDELKGALIIASRQINGRCKGFLEISSAKQECHQGDKDVKFMHSTVAEFLNQPNIRSIVEPRLSNIDMMDRLCQSFLAFTKSIDTDEFYSSRDDEGKPDSLMNDVTRSPFVQHLDRIIGTFLEGPRFYSPKQYAPRLMSRFLAFLGQIEQVTSQRIQKRLGDNQLITLECDIMHRNAAVYCSFEPVTISVPQTQLIGILAAWHLLFEYFDKDGQCNLLALHQIDPVSTKRILLSTLRGVSGQMYSPRAFKMLEILFRNGISPSMQVEWRRPKSLRHHGEVERKLDPWSWIIRRLIFMKLPMEEAVWPGSHRRPREEGFGYRLIELCLRYGAEENFTLTFGPCYEVIGTDRLIVLVQAGDSSGRHTVLEDTFRDICVDYHLDIVQYATKKGGVLTLRDILAHCFPQNCCHLFELLDKKQPDSTTTERSVEQPASHAITMPILFPDKNRYFNESKSIYSNDFFDAENVPKHCKKCLAHSEKCFEDFEAKLRDKKSRSTDRPRHEPATNGTI